MKAEITLLGTVRKNKPELPLELVTGKGRTALSTVFAYHNDATIASYSPKKGKVVTLMSSLHSHGEVDDNNLKKEPPIHCEKCSKAACKKHAKTLCIRDVSNVAMTRLINL